MPLFLRGLPKAEDQGCGVWACIEYRDPEHPELGVCSFLQP